MYSPNRIIRTISLIGAFAVVALLPIAPAVTPALDGGYPNRNTAEDEDAFFSFTTSADNTAMGFDALDSNTTASDNALASWIWRVTGRLNTGRWSHTATLLQNGMVLVAGGVDNTGTSASTELVPPSERDMDSHRQPQQRTRFSHGDVATKRHGPCCRGI